MSKTVYLQKGLLFPQNGSDDYMFRTIVLKHFKKDNYYLIDFADNKQGYHADAEPVKLTQTTAEQMLDNLKTKKVEVFLDKAFLSYGKTREQFIDLLEIAPL